MHPQRQLTDAAEYMTKQQLVWGNSGNISLRDHDHLWISASGTVISEISDDEFVKCPIALVPAQVSRKPSKELPMHQAVYQEREDVQCVLHASPFYSTMIACSDLKLSHALFVESMYYLYDIREVPYYHPGSQELANAVRACAADTNVIILRNHGVLVYDINVREALTRLQTLELCSKMTLLAHSSGIALKELSGDTVHEFIHHSGYKSILPRGART